MRDEAEASGAAAELAGPRRRRALFAPEFLEDLRCWIESDPKTARRALQIVEATLRDPLREIANPEPLRHLLAGAWSRRLTQEHRVVFLLHGDRVTFLQARYHY